MALGEKYRVSETSKFATIDLKCSKVKHVENAEAAAPKSIGTRLTKSTGKKIDEDARGCIGGDFKLEPNPTYVAHRVSVFEKVALSQKDRLAQKPRENITIELPNGDVKHGTSYETSPMDIAKGISKNLAKSVLVAEVLYSRRIQDDEKNVSSADGMEETDYGGVAQEGRELWDLLRPLIGDCKLRLLTWEDKDAQTVFWHSSAHCLGLAMEKKYGCQLTHGPPIENGFFYDCYMGKEAVHPADLKELDKEVQNCCKKKQTFDRLVLSKEEALDMFKYNVFKSEYINTRIPDGGCTTVYRNGDFIDLCRGPHVPYTTLIQAFSASRSSSTNWLGKVQNDSLQRVYGVSFPSKPQMKKYQEFQAQAKERDHRRVGLQQDLFFFHELSPGSAFFLPHGTRLYNKLMNFIREEYWKRGFEEVTTPNVFNMALWDQSGHALHYKENMFRFDVENAEFALKPMNCPGHCLMFKHRSHTYRELPIRLADFGVLHRNELSGALTGLTRVRRFCQDDAHIFCREDQIKDEVLSSLDFMKTVYDVFGMSYKLELSTKPTKALGEDKLWVMAEAQLEAALNEFAGKGNWRENPGDGAFYGPKIDIKVMDAMDRVHQCATVQLDFQLPLRFDLKYVAGDEDDTQKHPVMVHRAILGSVERMIAVLTEHYGGRWPFWLAPRQALVVPVGMKFIEYGRSVRDRLHAAGFHVDIDESTKTLNKKVREGEMKRYNFCLVVGAAEEEKDEVNIRGSGNKTMAEAIDFFNELVESKAANTRVLSAEEKERFSGKGQAAQSGKTKQQQQQQQAKKKAQNAAVVETPAAVETSGV